MFNLDKFIGYAKELDFLGEIGAVNLMNKTVLLHDGEAEHQLKFEDVIFLEEVGVVDGVAIFDKDVLGSAEGQMYQVELKEDKQTVQMHLLNNKLEVVESGEVFDKSVIHLIGEHLSLVGSIFELEAQLPKVDFNVRAVREKDEDGFTYYYACNNKEKEEVDLIKGVFLGDTFLEEEYVRITLSHDVYLDSVESGTLVEVSDSEFANFVTGATYNDMPKVEYKVDLDALTNLDKADQYDDFDGGGDLDDLDDNSCTCDMCVMHGDPDDDGEEW